MNILFVLENYYPNVGGSEVLFQNLTEGLVKRGHYITVVTHQIPGTKEREFVGGVDIQRIKVPQFMGRYLFTFLCLPKLFKIAKSFDVIHSVTYTAAVPAWLVSKIYKIKSVITIHEVLGSRWIDTLGWFLGNIHKILEAIIVRLSFDKKVTISEASWRDLVDELKKERNIIYIYPGIDYDFFDPAKYDGDKIRKELGLNDEFVYLFYGRDGVTKGFSHLLRATNKISRGIPNSQLVAIVADYNSRESYDIKDVVLLDPVDRKILPAYIKMADAIIVPSLSEGFGFCVAEAAAMGRPIVASNTGSIPEVISGKHLLVKPADSDAIADGVIGVSKKMYLKTPLKKFIWGKCIDEYEKVYKELLKWK